MFNVKKYSIDFGKCSALTTIGMIGALCFSQTVSAISVQVVDPSGASVSGFRWLLEEDNSHAVEPGVIAQNSLGLDFHASHAPVLNSGISDGVNGADINLSGSGTGRYFITVLPHTGHDVSGIVVNESQNADEVTVTVNPTPIPTAQISIFAFEDNFPINNAADMPAEHGLAGFDVLLFDAAGLYGMAGGQMIQDAFGNPLGTKYLADGTIQELGNGVIKTGIDGKVTVKNLAPGKYGVQIVPPPNQGWQQTTTIEGSKTIDAWVQANEPSFFKEFGKPGFHVFMGFVRPIEDATMLTGGGTVSGKVVNLHNSRPPEFAFYHGEPVAECWVGLNSLSANTGQGIYAQKCNNDSTFSIENVPEGRYQLVVWDGSLKSIISLSGFTVPSAAAGNQDVNLFEVPIFSWFGRLHNTVFYDKDGDGFMDADESPIPEQNINIRFRNGAIYNAMPTDLEGQAPFEEVFPFFHWLVSEVDYARFKATGVTYVVDAGGPVNPDQGWMNPTFDTLTPQPQYDADGNPLITNDSGNNLSRTIPGPVLTLANQVFLGQTSSMFWGKQPYQTGENGGISGMVMYASTRAEQQPQYAFAEAWEVGIPRVQLNLYNDIDANGIIDDINGEAGIQLADVDNYPLNNFPGVEDIDRNANGVFDFGDSIQVTYSDSWDDNKPTGCQGEAYQLRGVTYDCFDGLRNFNQVREGVFDGGYAFTDIPAGDYIVETATPPGYTILKEQDKNVDFGVTFAPQLLAVECAGDLQTVPSYLSLNSDGTNPLPGVPQSELVAAPFAGSSRPLCDRKKVRLADQANAVADFHLFTPAPKAARVVGGILNDLANEFDPNAPTFGEKYAPPWLPVSFRDWTGREVVRVYADEWGKFNAILPSTFTMNIPMPSGAMPNMLSACMNDPVDQSGQIDPFYNPQYTRFCYTFQYMPGTTTYLDTPVLPVAAFTGSSSFPLDCEAEQGTPKISMVTGVGNAGPYVPAAGAGHTISITSAGIKSVPNPAYDINISNSRTIDRDYGFGSTPGSVTVNGAPLTIVSWNDAEIVASVPANVSTGQLMVHHSNGKTADAGVTLTVGGDAPTYVAVGGKIQDAIDAAPAGGLVMVPPGTYNEMVIMHKPIRLQGYGAESTTINAIKVPGSKLVDWRIKLKSLYDPSGANRAFDLIEGQQFDPDMVVANDEPGLFFNEEGAGITVVGLMPRNGRNRVQFNNYDSAIDGLQIIAADQAGAIFVNGYADNLKISNNRLIGNHGTYAGGIRVGEPFLAHGRDAVNDNINIHHNEILQNGSLFGAGAGIALYSSTDHYQVSANMICGNFSSSHGGGIGHQGESRNGVIANNKIIFNQSFTQLGSVSGGGIYIGGVIQDGATLTDGSGSVVIDGNLIQGNNAAAGDGAGIRLEMVNGDEAAKGNQAAWNRIDIINNMIVNNVAGLAGGGISLQDALLVNIVNNTIANNDSTATASEAFPPDSHNQSLPQPAGIVSHGHSAALQLAINNAPKFKDYLNYSNPTIENNIIWHNRSFHFEVSADDPSVFGLKPDIAAGDTPIYHDLDVLGYTAGVLTPVSSIVSGDADPLFISEYVNGSRGSTIILPEITTIQTAVAFDEGGNFVDIHYGPLSLDSDNDGVIESNYHLQTTSPAKDTASANHSVQDFDGDNRPSGVAADIGADEIVTP